MSSSYLPRDLVIDTPQPLVTDSLGLGENSRINLSMRHRTRASTISAYQYRMEPPIDEGREWYFHGLGADQMVARTDSQPWAMRTCTADPTIIITPSISTYCISVTDSERRAGYHHSSQGTGDIKRLYGGWTLSNPLCSSSHYLGKYQENTFLECL